MKTQRPPSAKSAKRRRAAADLRDLPAQPEARPMMAELYRRAEARLQERQRQHRARTSVPMSADGPQRLLHELEVHQIELELQNAELHQARNELEVALEKYTDLYDFAPVGYFSIDETGAILEANLTGATLLGVERSRLINRRLQFLVAPPSQPALLTFLKKVFTTAKDDLCDVLMLREDGGAFWAGLRATPALSHKGTPKWCRVAVTDIGIRKQAEAILRQNEALFCALIAQAPIGVYVVDDQLRLQQVNPKALPTFRKVHPLLGRHLSQVMHILWPAPVADEIIGHFQDTLQTGQPFYSGDFSARRHDIGVEESYEWHLRRVTLPAGQQGVVCFFDDVTGRKRTEETLRRLAVLTASNEKLEREIIRRQTVEEALQQSARHEMQLAEQARRLAHQILHAQEEERKRISRELHDEIAQTLVSINVHLEALTREGTGNPKRLRRQIARTQRLVEKSVDTVHRFARELRPTALDDLGLIPALHGFMQEFTKLSGVRAHLRAFAAIEKMDIAMRTVLYRVAHEALNNVARHAQASHVQVSIERLPDCICMQIKDDGKSFNVGRVLKANGGRRLGLLGMRERVEMVGGNFMVESAPGKGTTIQAQLPLGQARARGGGGRNRLGTTLKSKPPIRIKFKLKPSPVSRVDLKPMLIRR